LKRFDHFGRYFFISAEFLKLFDEVFVGLTYFFEFDLAKLLFFFFILHLLYKILFFEQILSQNILCIFDES